MMRKCWMLFQKKDKAGRNDPCPCKSGKKYKKCCGRQTTTLIFIMPNLTPQEKLDIYKNLFKGRGDVFAVRWENKES